MNRRQFIDREVVLKRFDGKVAIVTGGSSGIGLATVKRLHDEGATVVIADLQAPIEEVPSDVRFQQLDVIEEEAWKSLVDSVVNDHSHVDVLVQSAGTATLAAIGEETLEGWNRTVGTNATGIFLGMREVLPRMAEKGGGAVVNVSSHFSIIGVAIMGSYQASKGAVTAISKHAAITYAGANVRVNTVHPGPTLTPLVMAAGQEAIDHTVAGVPLRRIADPSEQAAAIAFLASDDASFITGTSLVVDGGYTAA